MMACDCIEQMNVALAAKNTRIVVAFQFAPNAAVFPVINTEAVTPKRGFRPLLAIPSYCPFCGTKYAPPDAVEPQSITQQQKDAA